MVEDQKCPEDSALSRDVPGELDPVTSLDPLAISQVDVVRTPAPVHESSLGDLESASKCQVAGRTVVERHFAARLVQHHHINCLKSGFGTPKQAKALATSLASLASKVG